jgi:hypothetical protein
MFSVKVHQVGGETLVACCDLELLGKRLGDDELDLHVSSSFYGGQTVDEDAMMRLVGEATSANLIGDRTVELALRQGLVDEANIIEVGGVKHAQVYTLG